jgi:hypothetical protein
MSTTTGARGRLDDWAVQLASDAVSRLSDEPPEYMTLSADIALEALRGQEPAQQFPDETHRLAHNLVLGGYWARVAVMGTLGTQESSTALTAVLRRLRLDVPEHAEGWFGALQVAAYTLGGATIGAEADSERLLSDLHAAVPDDAGEPLRLRVAEHVTSAIREGLSVTSPGADDYLSAWDVHNLWEVGYWLRALELSLPEEALAELGERSN